MMIYSLPGSPPTRLHLRFPVPSCPVISLDETDAATDTALVFLSSSLSLSLSLTNMIDLWWSGGGNKEGYRDPSEGPALNIPLHSKCANLMYSLLIVLRIPVWVTGIAGV